MEQYSPEWFAERAGKATASRIADIVAKTRNGWGASRKNYMAELVAERLTGQPAESYTNAAMQWGIDTEPDARAAYEFYTGNEVKLVGFVPHPKILNSGASPDGLVSKSGLTEIKCPNTATHIDTLLGAAIPDKYIVQMQWQMACTGRNYCDFVSFDPRMPEELRLFVERMERDNERIKELEEHVEAFLAEVSEKVVKLQEMQDAS